MHDMHKTLILQSCADILGGVVHKVYILGGVVHKLYILGGVVHKFFRFTFSYQIFFIWNQIVRE